jgi:hypothetical protein
MQSRPVLAGYAVHLHVQIMVLCLHVLKYMSRVARAIIEGSLNMAKNYGQSGKENSKRNGSARPGGLGSTGRQGESDGDGIENRVDSGDLPGLHRDSKSPITTGKAGFGKMLSQLRELQHSHLAYIESHEERLQLRLKAAQEHHQSVTEKMKQLEQEILNLLGETVS